MEATMATRYLNTMIDGDLTGEEQIRIAWALSDIPPKTADKVSTFLYPDMSRLVFTSGKIYPKAFSSEEN